jgi:hypothetical protein
LGVEGAAGGGYLAVAATLADDDAAFAGARRRGLGRGGKVEATAKITARGVNRAPDGIPDPNFRDEREPSCQAAKGWFLS